TSDGGQQGGLDACESCSADVQCGGEDDLCVRIAGQARCAVACGAGNACPNGYTCSAAALTSENGRSARQCIPVSQSCSPVTPQTCMDDDFEDNDTRMTAKPLPQGVEALVSCATDDRDDEDWFVLNVAQEGELQIDLLGEGGDLDLG